MAFTLCYTTFKARDVNQGAWHLHFKVFSQMCSEHIINMYGWTPYVWHWRFAIVVEENLVFNFIVHVNVGTSHSSSEIVYVLRQVIYISLWHDVTGLLSLLFLCCFPESLMVQDRAWCKTYTELTSPWIFTACYGICFESVQTARVSELGPVEYTLSVSDVLGVLPGFHAYEWEAPNKNVDVRH